MFAFLGNWIAQWDTQYKAWFYYNIKTGSNLTPPKISNPVNLNHFPATSTWIKPPELAHVAFKSQGSVRRAAPSEGSSGGGGLHHSGVSGGVGGGQEQSGGGAVAGGVGRSGGGRQSQAGGAVAKSEAGPQTLHNAQMFYRS